MFNTSNAGSASAPSEEMDIDPWLEDTSDDDTSLPDVGHFRLQPRGSDSQVGGLLGLSTIPIYVHDAWEIIN
jgi:hypothetical protein